MTPMQKFLKLPVTAVNLVKNHRSDQTKSPVLTPDGGVQTFYNALQADELKLLKSPEIETNTENGGSGSQSQPVRYGASAIPITCTVKFETAYLTSLALVLTMPSLMQFG